MQGSTQTLTYGGIIVGAVVGLMRHWEWEQVGVHAFFGVWLICYRGEKSTHQNQFVPLLSQIGDFFVFAFIFVTSF